MSIDLNRGCTIRPLPSGKRVIMYKDQPGVYFDGTGEEVDVEEAAEAGFDVKRLDFDRRHQAAQREATARLTRDYEMKLQEIQRLMRHSLEGHTLDIEKGSDKLYRAFDENGDQVSISAYQRKSDLMDLFDQAEVRLGHDADEEGSSEPSKDAGSSEPSNGESSQGDQDDAVQGKG